MVTEARVRAIIDDPFSVEWTLQGFGMLRTYLDDARIERLQIWDQGMQFDEEVSVVHTHPWDFTSQIIAGALYNQRYEPFPHDVYGTFKPEELPRWWNESTIIAGEGGGLIGEVQAVRLAPNPREHYEPGATYSQEAPEIHESIPAAGTITCIRRTRFNEDRDIAKVFWREGHEWGTAEPRQVTADEIMHFVRLARVRLEELS